MKLKQQLLVLVAFCFAMAANAQEVVQGLKLPQLSETERAQIGAEGNTELAKGQVIYNTETNCLEFWNGTDWVPQCGNTTSTVNINPDTLSIGAGTFVGKTCFDIAYSNDNTNSCGLLTDRAGTKADFAALTSQDKTYTFTATTTNVTNVRYVIKDAEGCIAAITPLTGTLQEGALSSGSSVILTVNYKTTLSLPTSTPLIAGRTRGDAAVITINIIYYDGTKDVKVPMTIKIQDCMCCGAKIDASTFKVFMCHNLGADESADPFFPDQALHGAFYKWGVKDPALTAAENIATDGAIAGWESITPPPIGSTDEWDMVNANPCPAGYRVPTRAEWDGVIDNNGTWTPKGAFSNSATNWTSGVQIGDGLFLPTAGYRGGSNGGLANRGDGGFYWSSTTYSTTNSYHLAFNNSTQITMYPTRSGGMSVRCIQNE